MPESQPHTEIVSNYPRAQLVWDPEFAAGLLEGFTALKVAAIRNVLFSLLTYFSLGIVFGIMNGPYELAWVVWIAILLTLFIIVWTSSRIALAKVEPGLGWEPGRHRLYALLIAATLFWCFGLPAYGVLRLKLLQKMKVVGLPASIWTGVKKRQAIEMIEAVRNQQRILSPIE